MSELNFCGTENPFFPLNFVKFIASLDGKCLILTCVTEVKRKYVGGTLKTVCSYSKFAAMSNVPRENFG